MQKVKNAIQRCLTYVAVVVLAGSYPTIAFAEAADNTVSSDPNIVATPTVPSEPPLEPKHTYTYNPETQHWDSDKWVYNAATGQYEPAPQPLVVAPTVTIEEAAIPSDESTTTIDTATQATIDNALQSDAVTGNATVSSNTTAGNASTGDALAMATLMNMVNSSVSVSGADFATFVTDITGDVHGDIMLYPMLLKAMLQAATQPDSTTVNATTSAQITNDIDLNAKSGDAAVTNNTNAGNASSGAADTVANVMNIINSIIAAHQSFVGTINIHGNLDGDILIAPDFLPQLLASNTGSSSTPASSLVVSSQDTQSIINNINLNAASGDATVANNTNAGSATSGTATTNVVLLNLSGHQIVASDSLLVFVNVLGQWVGLILDAPSGTSAAALGNGVVSSTIAPDLTITTENNSQIINNINLDSQTGDATVRSNTNAGDATTGNATASANIANVSGSQFGLTGWFGVLFINVFGNWFGSFGIDTARGNQPGRGSTPVVPQLGTAAPESSQPFQFIPSEQDDNVPHTPIASLVASVLNNREHSPQTPAVEEAEPQREDDISAATASIPARGDGNPAIANQSQLDLLPFAVSAFVVGLGAIATKSIILFIRGRTLA